MLRPQHRIVPVAVAPAASVWRQKNEKRKVILTLMMEREPTPEKCHILQPYAKIKRKRR